jgi:mannose-1-phosphate guanylyltransferase
MLQQTIDRRRALVSRERILVSLNSRHRREAVAQLADLPEENLIFQPANLDTTAGILLPLAHVSHREPDSMVAVFPSDHFIRGENHLLTA